MLHRSNSDHKNEPEDIAAQNKSLKKLNQQLQECINELKSTNKELIKAKERATDSEKLKTAFIKNMSHEIRTPMNGIVGFTNLLANPDLSSDERQSYIEIVSQSSNRMLSTFNNLMEISLIETGQVSLNHSAININGELGDLYAQFRMEAAQKSLDLKFYTDLADKDANIYTDREKLSAILSNLLNNAIKYTPNGKVEFGYKKIDDKLEFYVKDTGIGIPAERQKAIFERFIQSDIDDTEAYQGNGLGLTIARSYVDLLGGDMRLVSQESKGSQFYFTIPYKTYHLDSPDTIHPAEENKKKTKKPKVLIVEDETFTMDYLSIILKNICSEIIRADNGIDAVNICRRNPDIDLILMDIKMPLMNGYDAAKEIRTFNKEVIIIAQTAYAMPGDREKALEAGCNDYISKPINKEVLISMIENMV